MHIPEQNVRAVPWEQNQVTLAWTKAVVDTRIDNRFWNNQIKKGMEMYPFIKMKDTTCERADLTLDLLIFVTAEN